MKLVLLFLLVVADLAVLRAEGLGKCFESGVASWYGHESSQTASGERCNPAGLTAAHRTLPFGTMVEVKNLATGRCVTVRVNDRGPFKKDRVIDVTKRAAQELGMIGSGTAKVELAVLK